MGSILSFLSPSLESPLLYLAYQTAVGGIRARRKCILEYIRPTPGLTVLDIGCGPGYTIRYFPEPDYYGFDVSRTYIEYARARFSGRGHFQCSCFDDSTATRVPAVDVVLLMGLLHHLNDREAINLLTTIKRVMKPQARLVTLDGAYKEGQSPVARYFLNHDRGRHVRRETEYGRIAATVFSGVQSFVRDDLFRIPYTTVVLECRH